MVGVDDTQLVVMNGLLLDSLSLHKRFLSLIPKGYAIVADFFLSAVGFHQQGETERGEIGSLGVKPRASSSNVAPKSQWLSGHCTFCSIFHVDA